MKKIYSPLVSLRHGPKDLSRKGFSLLNDELIEFRKAVFDTRRPPKILLFVVTYGLNGIDGSRVYSRSRFGSVTFAISRLLRTFF